jgi:hypothetical protein
MMASNKFEPVNGAQNENYVFSNGGYAATARYEAQTGIPYHVHDDLLVPGL